MSLNKPKPKKVGHGDDESHGVLLCDLHRYGYSLIHGSGENRWVFCPKQKAYRKKAKISECEQCPHFKGFGKNVQRKNIGSSKSHFSLSRRVQRKDESEGGKDRSHGGHVGSVEGYLQKRRQRQAQQSQGTKYAKLNVKKSKPRPKRPRITLTDKDFEEAIKRKEEEDCKFWEEEERLQKEFKGSDKKK